MPDESQQVDDEVTCPNCGLTFYSRDLDHLLSALQRIADLDWRGPEPESRRIALWALNA